jgi:hypothetical protein
VSITACPSVKDEARNLWRDVGGMAGAIRSVLSSHVSRNRYVAVETTPLVDKVLEFVMQVPERERGLQSSV